MTRKCTDRTRLFANTRADESPSVHDPALASTVTKGDALRRTTPPCASGIEETKPLHGFLTRVAMEICLLSLTPRQAPPTDPSHLMSRALTRRPPPGWQTPDLRPPLFPSGTSPVT
ncbi:hypothetical protein DPEC_G00182500 [Dallia pectoralis]|uniref:Uncharacterized protein n=1 Tax=Dallia pectoralis TaxID=75939 RepID=A0ACC2GA96_DALPE|nr:hypothetical protein DPEC_G00182500 [Dallia pectoralis]